MACGACSTIHRDPPWIAHGKHGMVAADSSFASQAGVEILQAGGNAIDAATATSFALAVTRPYSTGLGGGGFMIVRFADGRVVVRDYRETSPNGSSADMYTEAVARRPDRPSPSRLGHLAVAVPGLVLGRCEAQQRFGKLPLAQVMEPAIRLARDGFPVDAHYVETTQSVLDTYKKNPWLKKTCRYVFDTHLRQGKLRKPGDALKQPALARLLEGIAEHGAGFFYSGEVAGAIAKEMRLHGGLITEKDLSSYKVAHREPIESTYRNYSVIGMPPSSSGGVAIAEILNILEELDFVNIVGSEPVSAMHLQIEAMKHAFADRARWLGDGDFSTVPVGLLTSKPYAKVLSSTIYANQADSPDDYGVSNIPDDTGTSHFCVVDRWDNVVVSTETINTSFGSLAAVGEWGLIFNNQMDDFAAEPGKPNAYGLVQSDRNAIAPGKRPLSSMSPTIVLKKGEPFLLLGASGGPRIISSVLNVLLAVTDRGLPLERAIPALRPHHQWMPDELFFDEVPPAELRSGLMALGHQISNRKRTGVVQAILRIKDGWVGASDPKKGGVPTGY